MTHPNTPHSPCGDCPPERRPVPAGSEVDGERAKFEAAKLRTDCFPRIDIDMATATDEQIFAAIDEIAWRTWQARASLPAAGVAVPEGYKLVPVEPTKAMIDAGRWSEYGEETSRLHEVDDDDVEAVWHQMMTAAEVFAVPTSDTANFIRAREWAERYGQLEAAAEAAADALEECQSYTSCETWSPSMTEECERAAKELRSVLAATPAATTPAGAGMVLVPVELIRRAQQAINWHLEPDSPDEHERTMLELSAIGWPEEHAQVEAALQPAPSPAPAPAATAKGGEGRGGGPWLS